MSNTPFLIKDLNGAEPTLLMKIDVNKIQDFILNVNVYLTNILSKNDSTANSLQMLINLMLSAQEPMTSVDLFIGDFIDVETSDAEQLDNGVLGDMALAIAQEVNSYRDHPVNLAIREPKVKTTKSFVKREKRAQKKKTETNEKIYKDKKLLTDSVDAYASLVRDKASKAYGTLSDLMHTSVLYQNTLSDMKTAGILTLDTKMALQTLLCLPREQSSVLIKLLAVSGLSASLGGPKTEKNDSGQTVVNPVEAKYYVTQLESQKPPKMEYVNSFLRHPPGEHSAFKHATLPANSIDNPIGVPIPDPNAILKPVVVMKDVVIVSASLKSVYYNHRANFAASRSIINTVKNTDSKQFDQIEKDTVVEKNIFSCVDLNMDPILTRYTIKPLVDKKNSNALHTEIEGVRFHSQRSDKAKINISVNDPASFDMEKNVRVNFIPPNVFGGSRAEVCAAMLSTPLGKALIDKFVEDVGGSNYEKTRAYSFTDYQMFFKESLVEGPTQLTADAVSRRKDFATKATGIEVYWKDFVFKTVLKVLASHLGFLSTLGTEMSIAGLPCLPGVFTLKKSGAIDQKSSIVAINCHATLVACKILPTHSDFMHGQQAVGGVFLPLDEKACPARGVNKVHVKHQYLDDKFYGEIIKHKRYDRVGGVPSDLFQDTTVLIDLTIPGLLYLPQNIEKAKENKEFKGQGVLIDDPETTCLYDFKDLANCRAFMVYINHKVLLEAGFLRKFGLLKNFNLSFSPLPAACLLGVYLVGWRTTIKSDVTFKVRALEPKVLRNNVIVHLVTKNHMVTDHFSRIPIDPGLIYDSLTNFLPLLDITALDQIRVGVGTIKSIKEYIKRTRESGSPNRDFGYANDYSEFKANYDPAVKGVLDPTDDNLVF